MGWGCDRVFVDRKRNDPEESNRGTSDWAPTNKITGELPVSRNPMSRRDFIQWEQGKVVLQLDVGPATFCPTEGREAETGVELLTSLHLMDDETDGCTLQITSAARLCARAHVCRSAKRPIPNCSGLLLIFSTCLWQSLADCSRDTRLSECLSWSLNFLVVYQ